MRKKKNRQVRLDSDVVVLVRKYADTFPIVSTFPKLVNGLLRDKLKDALKS